MRWQQVLATVIIAGMAGYLGGEFSERAGRKGAVRAQRFELTDSAGKVRALLSVKDTETPLLEFLDAGGTPRAVLGLFARGQDARLELQDNQHKVSLGVFGGLPHLRIYDAKGFDLLNLGVRPSFTGEWHAHLTLIDRHGVGVEDHPFGPRPPRRVRAELAVSDEGRAALTLEDKDGNTRAVLGSTKIQRLRTNSVEERPEASLILFGPDGRALFSAPR